MGGVGHGAQAGYRLGEDDDADAHGQLLDHGGDAYLGDVADTFKVGLNASLGELKTDILRLFPDMVYSHDKGYDLAQNGGYRSAQDLQAREAEFAVNKLSDRGSLSARGIVTNVQDFIVNLSKELTK